MTALKPCTGHVGPSNQLLGDSLRFSPGLLRWWRRAQALASTMEVTPSEMTKGFRRMADSVEDLSLDVPGVQDKFHTLQARARAEGVLE